MKRVTALGATLALLLAPLLVHLLKAQSPPQGSATHFTVSPPALADVGFIFNFSVTTFDQSNNAAKSYTGTVHFTSTDPQAVLPADYTFTGYDSGTHMFSATLNTPGTQTITATDTANGAISGTSNSITVSATPPPPPPTYTLTDLGPLNITAAPSGATAFNASGQVTGFRLENFPNTPICMAQGAYEAFLWNNGTYTELGTLGGASGFGYGINNAGQIVGGADICVNNGFSTQRAFIWQNGTMTPLDPSTNSSDVSSAFAINTNGDVAGYINHANSGVGYQPVLWKGGTAAGLTLLAPLGCQFFPNCQGKAFAINDSGQAAGWNYGATVRGYLHAVRWDSHGQPTDLGSFGRYFNDQANAINSKGDVVGYSQLDPDVYYSIVRAAAWQSGNPQTPQDLGTIPGIDPIFGASANITDNNSSAWGINSKGDIVGISAANLNAVAIGGNGGRAFLYIPTPAPGTGGTMYDLLSLLAAGTNWRRLEAAWAINDNGQILGVGFDPNQQEHGFLLTPIITPTTTALATFGTPSVFGQQVSFTATVTPAPPNGNAVNDSVTFSDGGTTLGSGTYNGNGVWVFSTTSLSVGAHSITAAYSGDNNFAASTSTAVTQTIGQAGTVTGLAASANTPTVGQTVTFTATVTVAAPGAGTPTGTVTFSANGTPLTCTGGSQAVSSGQATCLYAFSTAGAQSITASYSGDTNFAGSTTASSVLVTVQNPPPSVVQVTDNETITITDAVSFPDVFDAEAVKVADAVWVTPLVNVGAPVAEYSAGGLGFSGQSGNQTITVSDTGLASLTLTSATISGSSQFAVTQISCTNSATSLSTVLPSGGVCTLTISYTASATPANDSGLLTFTDNAALSNLQTVASGSNYTQSIPLSGSGSSTPPPPPPPAVVPVVDNETITVTDTPSFPDVFDSENITETDQVSVQVLNSTTTSISITGGTVYGTPTSVTVSVSSSTATVTGNVTLSLDGGTASTMALTSGSATFNLGSLSVGPHVLATNFAAQGNFLGSSAATKFAVTQATPSISWKNPAPITYGTPLGSAQLNAVSSVAGTFIYSPAAGMVLNAGTQTLSVTFTPNDATDYTTAKAAVKLVVNQATPTITWANPAPITYGTALSGTQLNATATVSGSFAYTPALGTVLSAGTQTLSVSFTPADSIDYTTATASVTLVVNNTPTGLGVSVLPVDSGTGTSPVSLTFSNVTQAGVTSLAISKSGPATPSGFAVGTPPIYFNLSTTAGYKPPITVCINYAGISFPKNTPALFHYENGAWVNVTTSVDTTKMIICGNVTSLSPFALFAPLPVLTITAPSVPRQYGLTNPPLNNVTYSGFVNGDTPSVLSGTLSCLSPATPASPVGTYTITCSGLTSPNYTIKFAPGVLTITPAPLTVTAASAQRVYGASNPVLAGTIAGIQNGDNVTAKYSTTATPTSPVGMYTIVPALVDPTAKLGNYTVSSSNGTLTVIQASTTTALNVAPNPSNFGQSVTLTATVAPVAPGAGTATGKVTFLDGSITLGTGTLSSADVATFSTSSLAAGSHSLTASYGGDPNFSGSSSFALSDQVQCGVLISLSSSSVPLGGTITVTGKVISCSTTTQTVVVQFTLSGPSQPNSCSSMKSVMFTTPPFSLVPKTSQTASFPFKVPSGVCPGTYSITATTHANSATGTVLNTSTATLTITAH